MQRDEFVRWFCGKRDCVRSSGVTNWYNLRRIARMADRETIPKKHNWLTGAVLKKIEELERVPRKNLLAAAVSYLRAAKAPPRKIDGFVKSMNEAANEVDKFYRGQEKTPRQSKNWVTMREVKRFFKETKRQANDIKLWQQKEWSAADRQLAQKVLMLAFHGGTEPPPRLELATLRYSTNPTEDTGNLLFRKKTVWYAAIRHGKTTRKRGELELKFTPTTARLLNQFIKKVDSGDSIFLTLNGTAHTTRSYGKRLMSYFQKRFKKKVGAGLLRTIYLSTAYKNVPALKEIEKNAKGMMHAPMTALKRYTKLSD